jgi:prepilin-type N-terminal cleavage/methylation domain-containing protein
MALINIWHRNNKIEFGTSAGFTLIELMISMAVFSVILLLITTGVIHFTADYFKGSTDSVTQTEARDLIDTIAQAIQFSPTAPQTIGTGQIYVTCIGDQVFSYDLGNELQVSNPSGNYALLQANKTCPGDTSTPTGTELLSARSRLANLSVALVGSNLWKIDVVVASGDDDLFCDSSITSGSAGACNASSSLDSVGIYNAAVAGHLSCHSGDGSQFCSIASLSTTVGQRL